MTFDGEQLYSVCPNMAIITAARSADSQVVAGPRRFPALPIR